MLKDHEHFKEFFPQSLIEPAESSPSRESKRTHTLVKTCYRVRHHIDHDSYCPISFRDQMQPLIGHFLHLGGCG